MPVEPRLKPCQICGGRSFIHGEHGGYFCTTCQPGQTGKPTRAGGDREKEDVVVSGLPCAGCGSRTYTLVKDGYIFPDGSTADGWHCSGERCGAKLFSGNKKADRRQDNDKSDSPEPSDRISPAAVSWLRGHRDELRKAGWTAPELWRLDKSKGIAWLGIWSKPDVQVTLGPAGRIIFRFADAFGRTIQQTAWPGGTRL